MRVNPPGFRERLEHFLILQRIMKSRTLSQSVSPHFSPWLVGRWGGWTWIRPFQVSNRRSQVEEGWTCNLGPATEMDTSGSTPAVEKPEGSGEWDR